jgi:exopolysaccharide biosynthesis polyprenyl glycosylphosphotransferase
MYKQQVNLLLNTLMLLEGGLVIVTGYLAYYFRWILGDYLWDMPKDIFIFSLLFLMFVNNFLIGKAGMYSEQRPKSFLSVFQKLVLVVFLEFALLSLAYFFFKLNISRLFIGIYASILLFSLLLERGIIEILLSLRQKNGFSVRQIVLVGTDKRAKHVLQAIYNQRSWGHRVIGCLTVSPQESSVITEIPCLGSLSHFETVLNEKTVDEVVFVLPSECKDIDLKHYMRLCQEIGVTYRIVPSMYTLDNEDCFIVENIQNIPSLTLSSSRINASGLIYKRILDFITGLLGCIILGFMYPYIALAIKFDSNGPVLFKQKRMGQHGRIFSVYKFRTMYQDAESRKKELMDKNEMKGHMFKLNNDPRITRVGRLLRKTSLDEFPQFINVLFGEMSIVGTRPPTLDEVSGYEQWHRKRISIKPGITGLWQISGRNKISDFNEVVNLDLKYIDQWNLRQDLYIIFKTILVVLSRKGAF